MMVENGCQPSSHIYIYLPYFRGLLCQTGPLKPVQSVLPAVKKVEPTFKLEDKLEKCGAPITDFDNFISTLFMQGGKNCRSR